MPMGMQKLGLALGQLGRAVQWLFQPAENIYDPGTLAAPATDVVDPGTLASPATDVIDPDTYEE